MRAAAGMRRRELLGWWRLEGRLPRQGGAHSIGRTRLRLALQNRRLLCSGSAAANEPGVEERID